MADPWVTASLYISSEESQISLPPFLKPLFCVMRGLTCEFSHNSRDVFMSDLINNADIIISIIDCLFICGNV